MHCLCVVCALSFFPKSHYIVSVLSFFFQCPTVLSLCCHFIFFLKVIEIVIEIMTVMQIVLVIEIDVDCDNHGQGK